MNQSPTPRRPRAGVLHRPTCAETVPIENVCSAVSKSLAAWCGLLHGPPIVSSKFTLGNVLDPTVASGFMADERTPFLLGMTIHVCPAAQPPDDPGDPPPVCSSGLSRRELAALLKPSPAGSGGDHFVVLEACNAEAINFFTGVRLSVVPLAQFLACFGSLFKTQAQWTLPLICSEVLKCDGVTPRTVVLFSQNRLRTLEAGVEPHLLTSGFVFVMRGYPTLTGTQVRVQPVVIPAVPAYFRGGAERAVTPGSALVELVLTLAHPTWRTVLPSGLMGLAFLKHCYACVGAKTRDFVRLSVCRFILRVRYSELLALLAGRPVDPGDLYAACEALRLSLVMENDVQDDVVSRFLGFIKHGFGLERCVPWSWVARSHYRALDVLIAKHEGYIGPALAPSKPGGLTAQQLCDLVRADASGCPRVPPSEQTLAALMRVVSDYLLVWWRPSTAASHAAFFASLSAYLEALRHPALRAFLTPLVWGCFARNEAGLLPLAEHFLAPECDFLGSEPWVVPEDLLRRVGKRG
jgi:hypothetical protein